MAMLTKHSLLGQAKEKKNLAQGTSKSILTTLSAVLRRNVHNGSSVDSQLIQGK